MATYHARRRFESDLSPQDPFRVYTDEQLAQFTSVEFWYHHKIFWKVCLMQEIGPDAADAFAATVDKLPYTEQVSRFRARIEQEKARQLQEGECTCVDLPDGRGSVCPVCRAYADTRELPY